MESICRTIVISELCNPCDRYQTLTLPDSDPAALDSINAIIGAVWEHARETGHLSSVSVTFIK